MGGRAGHVHPWHEVKRRIRAKEIHGPCRPGWKEPQMRVLHSQEAGRWMWSKERCSWEEDVPTANTLPPGDLLSSSPSVASTDTGRSDWPKGRFFIFPLAVARTWDWADTQQLLSDFCDCHSPCCNCLLWNICDLCALEVAQT